MIRQTSAQPKESQDISSTCGQRGKVSVRRVMSPIMPIRQYLSITEKSIKSRNIPKMMIKFDCATGPTALLFYRRLASQACSLWMWSGRLAACEFLGPCGNMATSSTLSIVENASWFRTKHANQIAAGDISARFPDGAVAFQKL